MSKPLVSICIPAYYSSPEVPRVLSELLDSIEAQDYPRIQICVSIQETTYEEAMLLCEVMATRGILVAMPTSEVDGPAKNTNHAVTLAANEGYVKLMNQDDFLDSPTAISEMVEELETSRADWLINACIHTDGAGKTRERIHYPLWPGEKNMVEGVNRFGCPSVAMFKVEVTPLCDPAIEYAMDCDMWIQLYKLAGAPIIRRTADVVIRMWDAQLTNQYNNTAASLERDKAYMRNKYGYQ